MSQKNQFPYGSTSVYSDDTSVMNDFFDIWQPNLVIFISLCLIKINHRLVITSSDLMMHLWFSSETLALYKSLTYILTYVWYVVDILLRPSVGLIKLKC